MLSTLCRWAVAVVSLSAMIVPNSAYALRWLRGVGLPKLLRTRCHLLPENPLSYLLRNRC
jgi:hypothetical protein